MRAAPLLALALACGGKTPPGECVDDGDCDGIAVCSAENTCVEVQCLDSTQCPLGTHCDDHTCFTGCAEDGDCLSGEVCDLTTTQCVAGACRDTDIDCWWGQTCQDDVCAPLDGQCMPCSGADYTRCVTELGGQCRYILSATYCLLPCDPSGSDAAERPRGFDCTDIGYSSPLYVWWGDCTKTAPE